MRSVAWSRPLRLLISDTNVLIDFEVGGLLPELFRLDAILAMPDVLVAEELAEWGPELAGLGLRSLSLRPAAVARAQQLSSLYLRAGRNDLLALALAEQERCILLTGDAALRSAANGEGVEVRGSVWVSELLFHQNLVSAVELEEAFRRMEDGGRRLPWQEIEERIASWKTR